MRLKVNKLIGDRIFQNILLLSSSQVLNILIPLVTYPYLIWRLGLEVYGLIVFIQTFVSYFAVFVSYGLNIYFTREVSRFRHDHIELSKKFSLFIFTRIVLVIISIILMFPLILFTEILWDNLWLIIFSTYLIFNNGFLPNWYFQGIEKLKIYTAIYTVGRILYCILILLMIRSESDFLLVPLMNMLSTMITILVLFIYILIKHRIKWINPGIKKVILTLKSLHPFFLSNLSVYAYINSNKFILGSTLGMIEVGIYDLADKIVSLAKQPNNIIVQAIFPRISLNKKVKEIIKFSKISLVVSLIIFMCVYFVAGPITMWVKPDVDLRIIYVLKTLSISIPFITVSALIVNNIFIAFNEIRSYFWTVFISFLFYLTTTLILIQTSSYNLQNAAWNIIFVEVIVVILAFIFLKRSKIYKKIYSLN